MVDNMNPAPVPQADAAVEPKAGFFSTTLGKALMIAGGLAIVAALLATVGLLILGNGLFNAVKDAAKDAAKAPVTTASNQKPATPTEPATARDADPVEDVFTFRNPFVPTVKPPVSATTTSSTGTSGSTNTSSTASVPADTLALESIKTVDGDLVATFIWNGKSYTAGEGDTLEGTPWKVVNLTSSSATMLYGDSEVTLSVGQGISK
ncbi:MAG TPA: hypothetical protein VFG89_07440 [Coriobacteriia bacterium]|nr:hypothetical protein [Coriobacteriia bacterium]